MPKLHLLPVNGIEIAAYEWGEPKLDQPSILFVHATGFHAHIWSETIKLLPEFHCFAIDERGHGLSSKPAPPTPWRLFGEDVIGVGQALGLKGAIGVGHSIGGHAVTFAAAHQPDLFAALVLVDPVIFPPEMYIGVVELAHYTARRRRDWSSPDEMVERFKDRPPFNAWKPQVLRDYVDYGLLPNPGAEGYVLACSPEFEAATYNYATDANIYPEIATIQMPVTILRAGGEAGGADNLSASPTTPDLFKYFADAVDLPLPQYSHFIPMEAPEVVAEYVRKAVESV